MIDSIPLGITEDEPGAFLPFVDVFVDGKKMTFLLDTGAASSSIKTNSHTSKYLSHEKAESIGASGKATVCDHIMPNKLILGGQDFPSPRLKRCNRNILGLDLLKKFVFQIDFSEKKLNLLNKLPDGSQPLPIRRLAPGHVTISATVGDKQIDVLFDTGADTTVIDSQFIENHPKLFTFVRYEDGFDAHGNKIPSKVYSVGSLAVGDLRLKDVEIAAFDFGEFMRGKMEGAPIILGNNVITKGKWSFDLNRSQWTIEVY